MRIINLTRHVVVMETPKGRVLKVPPSGFVARVEMEYAPIGDVEGVDLMEASFIRIEGIPPKKSGKIYVVSLIVLLALNGQRDDVISLDTGRTSIRGSVTGKLYGVRRLLKVKRGVIPDEGIAIDD